MPFAIQAIEIDLEPVHFIVVCVQVHSGGYPYAQIKLLTSCSSAFLSLALCASWVSLRALQQIFVQLAL
jgi:hypothetical protein